MMVVDTRGLSGRVRVSDPVLLLAMQRLILVLVLAPLLVGGAGAQEPPPPTEAPPPPSLPSWPAPDEDLPAVVFRAEANYVEVDVSVTDDQGDFVRGLTRDDFEIYEEGLRQEIATFAEIVIPIEQFETRVVEGRPLPRDIATNVSGVGGRIYALVLDEAHTHVERSGVVREVARKFIEQHMAANDVATVVHAGGQPHAAQAFTNDKDRLLEAVSRFTGRKAPSATLERLSLIDQQKNMLFEPDPVEVQLAPRPGPEVDPWDLERAQRARASMETLKNVARDLGEVRGRRKAIVFFSEGIDYDTLDVMRRAQRDAAAVLDSMKEAIATATQHNVALYAIDPRGLVSGLGPEDIQMTAPARGAEHGIDSQSFDRELRRSRDSLLTLAEKTGGAAALNSNDFSTAYTRIVRANSQYYLLGYYPTDFRRDGEFRRIEVRVARPGATVVAREGYVRPRGEDEKDEKDERPRTRAVKDTSPAVRELLESAWPQPGLTLGVTAATFKGSGKDSSVAVTIQLPGQGLPFRQQDDRAVNEIEVSLIAIDQDGTVRGGDRMLVQPALSAETHELVRRMGLRFVKRLQLPPGRYQLRVAAREAVQGQRGSVFYDLQVPDFEDEKLAMSGVLLTSRGAAPTLTPAIDDQVKQILETPPTVARTFESEDVLTAYAEVYDTLEPTHDMAVTTRVVHVDGGEVFRVSGQRGSSEEFGYRVEIPLTGVGPGHYLLQIEARPTVGESFASRELSFEVARPVAEVDTEDVTTPPAAPEPTWRTPRLTSRIDRLEAWLTAVDQHEPGTDDGPARMVRFWTPEALRDLTRDLGLLVRIIDDPKHPVLWQVDPARPGRPQRSDYSTEDDRRLRAMAHEAAERCTPKEGAIPHADAIAQCARNRILKRGAILHTDAAMFVMLEETRPRGGGGSRPDRWRVSFGDGRQRGAQGAPGHWVLAQALLDFVAPEPDEDETVRLWYIATSAWGQYYERHTRHEDRAAQLFPKDADVLFFAGTLHETLASPTIQSLMRSISVPGSALTQIGSERDELEKAEKLFRRALKEDPALTEARIRRGRVLHRLGKHKEAARELQQAVSALSSDESTADDVDLLLYYAEMFLGAAAEALGRHDQARASYARAAELYPGAPSPRLALSQLAHRRNDRAAALDEAREALRRPLRRQDRDDPWWRYHSVQGRGVPARFEKLYQSLTGES
jgi:VWFA-related protein